jgi:hypothetical protein
MSMLRFVYQVVLHMPFRTTCSNAVLPHDEARNEGNEQECT